MWSLNLLQCVPVRIISDKILRTKIWLSTLVLCVSLCILHDHAESQVVFTLKVLQISSTFSQMNGVQYKMFTKQLCLMSSSSGT